VYIHDYSRSVVEGERQDYLLLKLISRITLIPMLKGRRASVWKRIRMTEQTILAPHSKE